MELKDLIATKTVDDLINTSVTKLKDLGFRIKNFRPGRVFYTLLELAMQAVAGLYELLMSVLIQVYLHTATGGWLDLKAAEYGVFRKEAQKTQGQVTVSRLSAVGQIIIPEGTIFKTDSDLNGQELRFMTTQRIVLDNGQTQINVPVEAEFEGAIYNVGEKRIANMVTLVSGIDTVTNTAAWVTREGSNIEDDESLRQRALNKWQQLALGVPGDSYASLAQEVVGVVTVRVDDQHPRGQGTIDVIVTGAQGLPTQQLINDTQAYINKKKSIIADVLVLAPEAVAVPITATLYIDPDYGDVNQTQTAALAVVDEMFRYQASSQANAKILRVHPDFGIDRSMIITNLRTIVNVVKVQLDLPAADQPVTKRQIAIRGATAINVVKAVRP